MPSTLAVLAAGSALAYILGGALLLRRQHHWARLAIVAAAVLHGCYIGLIATAGAGVRIDIGSALAMSGVTAALLAQASHRHDSDRLLALTALGLAGLSLAAPILLPTSAYSGTLDAYALVHALLSISAWSCCALAAIQALLMQARIQRLRRHRLDGSQDLLPSLEAAQQQLLYLLKWGFALLSLALASGFWRFFDEGAGHIAHKAFFSMIAWLLLAGLLLTQRRQGLKNRTLVALTLICFVFLALAYFFSKFVLEHLLGRSWQS